MTRININGKIVEFDGPIEIELNTCPICESPEVVPVEDMVPLSVVKHGNLLIVKLLVGYLKRR